MHLQGSVVSSAYANGAADERMRQGHVMGVRSEGMPSSLAVYADWLFYTANNHVLLAVLVGDPSHPYSLNRRKMVLATSCAFAFFLAACLFSAGYALPSVPEDYPKTLALLALLRDLPTTLSVSLQLLWDVPGGTLWNCPCARAGPVPLRKPCGLAMLCCHSVPEERQN